MKQYLSPEQTAKLIELGFEKPKSISGYCQRGPYEYDAETNSKIVVYDDTQYPIYAYSIGELIELLPRIIEYKGFYYGLQITTDCTYSWDVRYEPSPYEKGKPKISPIHDSGSCLLDKLYEVLLQLVEMKDEFTDVAGHKEYNGKEVISQVFKLKEEGVI